MLHGIVDVGSEVLITDRLAVFVVGAEKKIGGVDDVQKPTPVFGDPVPRILGMREQAAAQFRINSIKTSGLSIQTLVRRTSGGPTPGSSFTHIDSRPPRVPAIIEPIHCFGFRLARRGRECDRRHGVERIGDGPVAGQYNFVDSKL